MKRFHSHKNGCQWKKEEVVRYWFAEDFKGAGNWAVVKAVNGYLVSHSSNGEETGVAGFSVDEYLGIISDSGCSIEVQESDLNYLQKPDGDWEFRKVEIGDVCKWGTHFEGVWHGATMTYERYSPDVTVWLSGRRWCAPRKVDAFEAWWRTEMFSFRGQEATPYEIAKTAWYAAKREGE